MKTRPTVALPTPLGQQCQCEQRADGDDDAEAVAGLLVLALWGLYKAATPMAEGTTTRREMTAD